MWNACGILIVVLFYEKCSRGQDILQETTTLLETLEETSDSANITNDSSTDYTDNPDHWHSFSETIFKFNKNFNDRNTSFTEWKTDNLSIFGTSNIESTIDWNIFEDSIITSTERMKHTNNLQSLITTTIENDYELDVVEDVAIFNTETTDILGKYINSASTTEFTGYGSGNTVYEEPNMSALILKIMEELKNPDPAGIPGVDIPDPNPIPDTTQSITIFDKLHFTNSTVRGLSKLRILYININVEALEVEAAMFIDKLLTSGQYRYSSFMLSRNGIYSVDIRNLLVTARANLGVQRDGKLRAQDITMDLKHESIDVNFENIDPILAGLIKDARNVIFDTVKPYMLQDAYTKARTAIDTELEKTTAGLEFPNSLPPLDMILIDIGKKIRDLGLDPYRIKDYVINDTVSFVSGALYNTCVTGVSTFHRVGNITMNVANGNAILEFEVGTKAIDGKTYWNITVGKVITKTGKTSFSIEQISLRVVLNQPLDVRKKPILKDLQIEIGNLQMRSHGAGTIDYILETAVNILPNLLRYQIVDVLEWAFKNKIQDELDKINVEETIKQELLPKIYEIQKTGFKLSFLRAIREETNNDDEFFNF